MQGGRHAFEQMPNKTASRAKNFYNEIFFMMFCCNQHDRRRCRNITLTRM